MKFTILSFCLSLVCTTALHARTWIVDNDMTRPADYRTAQAAHDGAAVDDTLLFVGSGTDYNTLDITKRLNIEGPGYDLILNGIASANTASATISNITISAGDPIVQGGGASNSTVKGMVFGNLRIRGGVTGVVLDQVQGINPAGSITGSVDTTQNVLDSSLFVGQNMAHVSGLVIRRSSLGSVTTIGGSASVINCKLTFGAFAETGSITSNGGAGPTNQKAAAIACSQCIIGQLPGASESPNRRPSTADFTNCIILGAAAGKNSASENGQTITGSVLFSDAANYPGNRTTADRFAYSEVFVTNSLSSGVADSLFRLNTNPTNPALGAGVGGGDAGMFAGAQPYKLSGIPARPRVTYLNTSGVVSDTVGLNVQAGGEVRP